MRRPARTCGRVLTLVLSLAAAATARGDGEVAADDLDTQLMLATVKVSGPEAAGTAFVLNRPAGPGGAPAQWVLVTAGHTLNRIRGDSMTVVYHRRNPDGSYSKAPARVPIRRGGKTLWTTHPSADVAVLAVTPPSEAPVPAVSVDLLATDADLSRLKIHPGDPLRCVGFPHPNQFDSGEGGFAVVRAGCIAGYPLLPTKQTKTFLADFNTFEGDSGAAVYLSDPARPTGKPGETTPARLILGLVSGQHFLDEEYRMVYQSGKFRHRMGLGVIVHASALREAVERLPREAPPK